MNPLDWKSLHPAQAVCSAVLHAAGRCAELRRWLRGSWPSGFMVGGGQQQIAAGPAPAVHVDLQAYSVGTCGTMDRWRCRRRVRLIGAVHACSLFAAWMLAASCRPRRGGGPWSDLMFHTVRFDLLQQLFASLRTPICCALLCVNTRLLCKKLLRTCVELPEATCLEANSICGVELHVESIPCWFVWKPAAKQPIIVGVCRPLSSQHDYRSACGEDRGMAMLRPRAARRAASKSTYATTAGPFTSSSWCLSHHSHAKACTCRLLSAGHPNNAV